MKTVLLTLGDQAEVSHQPIQGTNASTLVIRNQVSLKTVVNIKKNDFDNGERIPHRVESEYIQAKVVSANRTKLYEIISLTELTSCR